MATVAFFAFPSGNTLVVDAIRRAVDQLGHQRSALKLESWEELDIPGRFISTEILSRIDTSDALVADITRLNFNVVYEVGYAIGRGKRVLLVKHKAISDIAPTIQDVGIFDTLGYRTYATADELAAFLRDVTDLRPIPIPDKRNEKTPIYLVQPALKTDYDGLIAAAVKKSLPCPDRSFSVLHLPQSRHRRVSAAGVTRLACCWMALRPNRRLGRR